MLAATLFWGTSATLARFMFRDRHVPTFAVVEMRLASAVALLGPWLLWRRPESLRIRREDWGYFLVLGVLGVAAIQCTYYYSVATLGVGLAILIQYLAPTLIVIFDAPSEAIVELERGLNITEEAMRHLVTRIERPTGARRAASSVDGEDIDHEMDAELAAPPSDDDPDDVDHEFIDESESEAAPAAID